jgi:hypothetical protein
MLMLLGRGLNHINAKNMHKITQPFLKTRPYTTNLNCTTEFRNLIPTNPFFLSKLVS